MARTDSQTDAHIGAIIASLEERIEIAQLAQITLSVESGAATDVDVALAFAHQIASQQQDVETLTAAVRRLTGLRGATNTGNRVRNQAAAAATAAQALIAARVAPKNADADISIQ